MENTVWAGNLFRDFDKCFLKVPLACLGSMAAAVWPNSMCNTQKTFYKTCWNKLPPQTVV